jgi:hypothetical protein
VGFLTETTSEGRRITLGSRCLIGRHTACDLRVDRPRVSGEHAVVHWTGDRWELRDLGSRNGTVADGRKLVAGKWAVLGPGSTFTLGGEVTFRLDDASPPGPSARHAKTGLLRSAVDGLLVLPDDESPELSIFEDHTGLWVAEDGDGSRRVADRDIVIVDGEGWVLDLPSAAGATVEPSGALVTVEAISIHFAVSRDEEHVEVTVFHGGGQSSLPARTHHYLLLTLARRILDDEGASPAERGWVDRETLCRMLATDPRRLNVDIFRVRKQLADLGIYGAAGIIARRPGTGQLRLGTHRVEVHKL